MIVLCFYVYIYLFILTGKSGGGWLKGQAVYLLSEQFVLICRPPLSHGEKQ